LKTHHNGAVCSAYTTGNLNISVGDDFFCVFLYTHRKIHNFFCAFRKPTEKLCDFSVRVNTHRKIDIILSVFSKLTEKLYKRTDKLYTVHAKKKLNLSPDMAAHTYPKRTARTRPHSRSS